MKIWLAKTDPLTLSITDLEKKGIVQWKKVRHPKAMQFMLQMKPEDKILIYHSNEKKIVGVGSIVNNNPDPTHPRGRLVDVKFIKKFDESLVSLDDVKKSGKFDDFRLVREPRLSVMDIPDNFLAYFKIKI